MHHPNLAAMLAVACILLAYQPTAGAQQIVQNGAGACRSALPVFDGNIRNRPTAVANEGTSHAFVSCSMEDRFVGQNDFPGVWLYNTRATAVDVTCTLVPGSRLQGGAIATFTKTRTYPAGSGSYILWNASDNGGNLFTTPINFSCNLPPGIELRLVTRSQAAN